MKRGFKRTIAVVGLLTAAVALSAPANAPAPLVPAPANARPAQSTGGAATTGWKPLGRPPVQPGARRTAGPAVVAGHTPQRNVSISVRVQPVPVDPEGQPKTYAAAIAQNFPNPFVGSTTIRYTLAQAAPCQIAVYNVTGQRVATLVNESLQPGEYAVRWNGRSDRGDRLRSGLYFYRITAGSFVRSRKLIVR